MSQSTQAYNYIITGLGCAGLSLAVQLDRAGLLKDRKLLLLDKDQKNLNDRTWCFWETAPGPFEEIVYRHWNQAWFHAEGFSSLLNLAPYQYKMIRGIDYYNYCLDILQRSKSVDIIYASVDGLSQQDGIATVSAGGINYTANWVFNSILFSNPPRDPKKYHLLQHFKGWVVETEEDFFRPEEPTLMDFRPSQKHGTTFVYVMPFSARRALVEYTLFSPALLTEQEYEKGLRDYLKVQLGAPAYRILDEEFGIIPMTNQPFPGSKNAIIQMGTAGGQTKASSGYTYSFIQKQTAAIVESLKTKGHPHITHRPGMGRFHWYDSVLLNILHHKKLEGWYIFRQLFRKNKVSTILRFLDNDTNLAQEIGLLNSLPQWPFMKAGMQEFWR
jgi:lycopene beta-cyclase